MEEIIYSRATPEDLETIIDLRIAFLLELSGPPSSESIQELKRHFRNYLERSLQDNYFIVYLARCGNDIAGIGGMVIREQPGSFKNPGGKVGYIMNMYTVPSFRKKRIGSNILRLLRVDAGKMGIVAFELHATEQGENMYRQDGFVKYGETTYRKYMG